MSKKDMEAVIDMFIRSTVKPGDTVYHYMGAEILVVRVNKRTITSTWGNVYRFNEIATHETGKEMAIAFKAWRESLEVPK